MTQTKAPTTKQEKKDRKKTSPKGTNIKGDPKVVKANGAPRSGTTLAKLVKENAELRTQAEGLKQQVEAMTGKIQPLQDMYETIVKKHGELQAQLDTLTTRVGDIDDFMSNTVAAGQNETARRLIELGGNVDDHEKFIGKIVERLLVIEGFDAATEQVAVRVQWLENGEDRVVERIEKLEEDAAFAEANTFIETKGPEEPEAVPLVETVDDPPPPPAQSSGVTPASLASENPELGSPPIVDNTGKIIDALAGTTSATAQATALKLAAKDDSIPAIWFIEEPPASVKPGDKFDIKVGAPNGIKLFVNQTINGKLPVQHLNAGGPNHIVNGESITLAYVMGPLQREFTIYGVLGDVKTNVLTATILPDMSGSTPAPVPPGPQDMESGVHDD